MQPNPQSHDDYYHYLKNTISPARFLRGAQQWPYRWNLRRLKLGRVLDIGCGLGRHLRHQSKESVGIDINPRMVEHCQRLGLIAEPIERFPTSPHAMMATFDTLLISHVLEHMTQSEAGQLVQSYLPYLKRTGRVVIITPQELGFATDPTHQEFIDDKAVRNIADAVGWKLERWYSFPFPRWLGKFFRHNEFVCILVSV